MTRRRPAVAALGVALALAVVACAGGARHGEPERADAPTTSSAAPAPTATAAPASTAPATTAATVAPPPTPALATTAPGAPGCLPVLPRRTPDPTRPRYEVAMTADPATGVVEGSLDVRFRPDLPVDRLVFRLWPNGPRPAAAGARLEPGPPTSTGRVLRTERPDPTTLVVLLDPPLSAGATIEVTVPWRLEVPGSVKDRISRSGGALRLGSFLPLLAWEPGRGWATEPPTSGFAEAATTPAADWRVHVTVPAGYGALATGVHDGRGTWSATAARDFALSVGRFTYATATARAPQPVAVTVGVHDRIDDATVYLARVVAAIEDFSRRFGPYPFPTYTLALTPELSGGIEFPMHVMQGPGTEGRTTPHEVAHMWFYGLVGNNQARDPWLDEGLASYAEARFEGSLGAFRSKSVPASGRGRAGEPMTYWEVHPDAYYRAVYVQTAVALADLGEPDVVDCALARFVARNATRIAVPDDLRRDLAEVFPAWRDALAPAGLG